MLSRGAEMPPRLRAGSAGQTKTAPVLRCQNLGIQFGGLKAVSDFNIEIGQSELVGLIGPNGAGKTTVFNLITGVYKPTEGSFYLNGQRMNGKKTHQIVHAGIARTFQNIRLFKKMTVLENVKAAMLEELPYSMPQAIFRTKAYWAQEQAATERAKRANPRILSPSLHFFLICSLFQVL